jgi:4-amino-4-deoxy-L-arabinose transferase-like glycosyltransferase
LSLYQRRAVHVAALLLVAAAVFLPRLGEVKDIDGREARHAKIAQTMLQTGVYSVPYVNGRPYIDKPPLFNWVEALFYRLSGRVSFLVARLSSVLCAIGVTLGLYVLGGRWLSRRAGFLAALIWTTSWLVIEWARFSRPDMMLAALVFLAIVLTDFAATAGPGRRRTAFWCGAAVALGAATLSKGPQCLFYWGVATAALWPVRGGRRVPPPGLLLLACAIIGVIVAAWLIPAERFHPGHLRALLGYQFGEGLVEHPKRISFYFDQVLMRTVPWGFFVVGAAIYLVRRMRRTGYDVVAVPGVVVAVCLVSLTILTNKGAHYLLPVLPMWALLLGMFADRALAGCGGDAEPGAEGVPCRTFASTLGLCLALVATMAAGGAVYLGPRVHGHATAVVAFFVLLAGLSAAGLGALVRRRTSLAFGVLCAALVLAAAALYPIRTLYGPQGPSQWAGIFADSGPLPEAPPE